MVFALPSGISTKPGDNSVEKVSCSYVTRRQIQYLPFVA
jgi:hypothetical protein